MLALNAHPHARAVLGAALKGEPAHAYLLHGPAGSGKKEAARAFAGELLARGAKDPENDADAGAARRAPRSDVGRTERRPRDARRDVDEAGRRRGRAHAVRGQAPDLRARARGRDERRGGERAAEDARGAAVLRRPDPAHGPADAGPADDRVPLPGRALRPAAPGALAQRLQSQGVAAGHRRGRGEAEPR